MNTKKMIAAVAAAVCAGMTAGAQVVTNVSSTALKVVGTIPEAAQMGDVTKSVEATSDWLVTFTKLVDKVDDWVWGIPLIASILVTGFLLTCILRFLGPHSGFLSSLFLMVSLSFFAFTTILGWDYYSEKCLEYIVGTERKIYIKAYRLIYVLMVLIGPYLTVSAVWGCADIANGLMAFPNLIALVLLSPVVWKTTKDYFERLNRGEIKD